MNEQQVGKASRIATLIVGNMQDSLTTDEKQELNAWLQEDGENFLLYEELMDDDKLGEALDELHSIDPETAYEKLSQKLFGNETGYKRTHRIWWYMVAAALLIVAGGVIWFSVNKKTATPMPSPVAVVTAQKKQPGALPDSKKAILTLADGSVIELNAINNGAIAQQGNSTVHKKRNGELEYTLSGQSATATGYNTLHTPRGGEYRIVLDDGTRIWLNSASTLTFPVHFNGEERRLQLSGEGYFEVAPAVLTSGHKKPFIVSVDNMQVQAVGTSFNISAYKEDKTTQTTVVEGLVKVSRHNGDHLLSPGKKLVTHDSTAIVEDADINQDTAWKNGEFVFHNTSLQMVMNDLARWYDMEVEYEKPVPSLHFSGEIERESDISKVLQMLQFTGGVKFSVTGRVIKVLPNRQ